MKLISDDAHRHVKRGKKREIYLLLVFYCKHFIFKIIL